MRPEDAKRLLNDPVLKESMQLLREKYRKQFENADPTDVDKLQLVRIRFDQIRDLYAELSKILNEQSLK